ncbi:NADPH-dependent FMN reductase [Brevibacillus ruminantium]|uniref:NADPH-dependent FMN reductase n=1 Tax=Brevibacillus ruminantium TaxID=2950604 RepID=A0ABY4WL59_9BACL|nr:NADPH-dependent FMN reductase [Brevibacillus ruminantium]USG66878.1 NADPH-dependent FMN reductase [Brevibacillus ruminantium]
MARIVIISGSPNHQSRLLGLIGHTEDRLQQLGHEVSLIAVADLPAEDLIRANFTSEQLQRPLELVTEADAVIIASPVYKAAYSGILKTFLDLLPQKGLKGKVVLPLFIGGTIAHLLAIDYALKPVVAALGGTHILSGVYGVDQWVERLEGGGFELSEELRQRLETAVQQLDVELQG